MVYYKVLAADGCSPIHGGKGKWFLPKEKGPGEWMPAVKPVLCESGYHFVTLDQLPKWIGPTIYEVEVRGEVLSAQDKGVATQARLIRRMDTWNEKTLRLFAADCAEHVLGIYEKQYPKDERPRKAIQAARDFANGLIDANAAKAAKAAAKAARYAAHDAAANAVYAAAYAANAAAYAANANAAAYAAYAAAAYANAAAYAANANAAAYAAYAAAAYAAAAARYAVYDAAAAYDADYNAETQWQANRLKYYLEVE
jgi:hypothetical protein